MRFQVFILSTLLAGCASQGPKVTPLERREERPVQPAQIELPKIEPKPIEPVKPVEPPPTPAPPVVTPAPAAAQTPEVLTGWLSLKEWCLKNNVEGPIVKITTAETNVLLKTETGNFQFDPPRRNARWNGALVGVGFPLQFTNSEWHVHAIDVVKVLQPLMLSNAPRKNGGIVVIDAGHGGPNFGTLSHDRKLKEKDLTLDWALRIQKLLEGTAWKAVLTRPVDLDLGLTNRVAFAENEKADLFISLHFNSFSNQKEDGIETYCFTPQGMASHLTRGYADEINVDFPNNRYDVENLLLAYDLHRSVLKHTGRKDRGIRRARFMTVLRDQNRPAVLIEGGYLSNPAEAKLIATPEYRQKLAEAVVEALGVHPKTLTTLRE